MRVPPQFAAITIAEPYIMRSFVPLTSLCITTSIITVVERLSKFAEIMKVVTHKSHNNFVAFRVRSVLPKKLKHSLPFRTSVMPSVASKNKITSQASAMYLGNTLWATKELKSTTTLKYEGCIVFCVFGFLYTTLRRAYKSNHAATPTNIATAALLMWLKASVAIKNITDNY